jgi:thioesterase domain-containing protein
MGRQFDYTAWLKHDRAQLAEKGLLRYTAEKARRTISWLGRRRLRHRIAQGGEELIEALAGQENPVFIELGFAASRYRPGPYRGPALLVRRAQAGNLRSDYGWSQLMPNLDVLQLESAHLGFFFEPQLSQLAEAVTQRLSAARPDFSASRG